MLRRHDCLIASLLLSLAFAGVAAADDWKPAESKLMTRWAKDVSPKNALPEYPRPQMVRPSWQNLNGLWDYAITARGGEKPQAWEGKILVPYCIESPLSGVGKRVSPDQWLWYRREFSAKKPAEGGRLLLHFGAVDWKAMVHVNGKLVGEHKGGYDPFTLDISPALQDGTNELTVAVWDPTDAGYQPRGKQVLEPRGIWYTPVTGIWQTAWLESVPATYVRSLKIVPDVDASAVSVTVFGSNEADVRITADDGGTIVGKASGRTGYAVSVPIANPKLWSPDSPHLYDLKIELVQNDSVTDTVQSYAGLRKIEVAKDEAGVNRMMLNGKPLFQYGPLDQGWWPDGLYTAATDEALKYDVEITKAFGFNMTRKHVKVEPERWYYWCDKLGLLVWQDMPSGDDPGRKKEERLVWIREWNVEGPDLVRAADSAQQYNVELEQLVTDFGNHPSIVVWVPFNERWGQFETERVVESVRRLDTSRLVNSASGGNYLGVGDVLDVHQYPDPLFPGTDPYQAVVCGEFGGLGLPLEGHTLLDKGNWGYRSYENQEALTAAYLEKIEMLKPMIKNGLAAAIYTQITDVEIEVNGLLTYDREVRKMDPKVIGKANAELYKQ
ncbi:MAG: beta-galactosidase [Planctomycetaceae bacterium]|nr:beta-galactosidase [Planctomycetaceae bacterium]